MIEWLDTLQEALKPYPWAYSAIVAGVLILVAFLVNWITKRILLRGLQRLLSTLPARQRREQSAAGDHLPAGQHRPGAGARLRRGGNTGCA